MKSLSQFFDFMNDINFPYVVLRNFDNLPYAVEQDGHGDLDLLVYDLDHWQEIFPQAKREFPHPRVRFSVSLDDSWFYVDIRYLGDGYYPLDFEKEILKTREFHPNGFYVPNATHFRLALAYHVVHHKGVNTYERWLGNATVDELFQMLKKSIIGWSKPDDPTVGSYNAYWRGATATIEKTDEGIIKKQVSYKDYNLLENESRILKECNSCHFPKIIKAKKDKIIIEDCGQPLIIDNLPLDWKEQLIQIILELKAHNIQHRDIRPDNLMIKDGIIKLIDFGWSRFYDDVPDEPPSCLGYPYKPSYGFDDSFSMRKIIKQFEFAKEKILVEK
jgi:hypothetical protein